MQCRNCPGLLLQQHGRPGLVVLLTLKASELTPDWTPREIEVQTWAGIDEALRQRVGTGRQVHRRGPAGSRDGSSLTPKRSSVTLTYPIQRPPLLLAKRYHGTTEKRTASKRHTDQGSLS
jgi:hypothetical protein